MCAERTRNVYSVKYPPLFPLELDHVVPQMSLISSSNYGYPHGKPHNQAVEIGIKATKKIDPLLGETKLPYSHVVCLSIFGEKKKDASSKLDWTSLGG